MKYLLYLSFLLLAFASCRKDNTSFTNPSDNEATFSARMTGTWIWMGSESQLGSPQPPDAFTQFGVFAVNDKTIAIGYDTLKYVGFDEKTHIIDYEFNESYTYVSSLHFNTVDYSMEYSRSNAHGGALYNTGIYKPNNQLHNYMPDIIGAKAVTGTGYDTFVMRNPMDSLYTVNTTLNITATSDSSLTVDNDLLSIHAKLNYKLVDETTKNVVFQTFHTYNFDIYTLTYNYASKALTFEFQSRSPGWFKYLKLQ